MPKLHWFTADTRQLVLSTTFYICLFIRTDLLNMCCADEERAPALKEMMKPVAPKKVSSLRKWGPAMIAIALVIAINAALFRNGTPELSQTAQRKLSLTSERIAAIESMEASSFEVRGGFGNRNLSEEEGGVMEYTRRRHRYRTNRDRNGTRATLKLP